MSEQKVEIIKLSDGINCHLRYKKVGVWLNSFTEDFHKKIHSEVVLITCVHDPYKISKNEAWKTMKTNAYKARRVIESSIQNVSYILEAIETHQKPPEKPKEEPPKEETKEEPRYKKRLEGYPHVHFVVAFSSLDGQFPDENKIRGALLEVFDDPDVRHREYRGRRKCNKKEFNSHAKILGYVLKNNRHKSTYENLNNTYPVTLYNISQTSEVHNFFHKLLTDNSKTVFINNVEAPQEPVTLQTQQPLSTDVEVQLFQPEETNTFNKAMKYISNWLMKNKMYQYGTHIYKLKEGTKNTYLPYKDVNKIWFEMLTLENSDIISRHETIFKKTIENETQNFFPKFIVDYEWIEYNDFYLHLPTKSLTEEKPKEPCFYYSRLDKRFIDVEPEVIVGILKNSGYIKKNKLTDRGLEFIKLIYSSCLVKRTRKTKVPVMCGDSNAGKSVFSKTVETIFPEEVILRLTNANGFFPKSAGESKIVILDEGNPKDAGLSDENLLKLGEADSMMSINHKGIDPSVVKLGERMLWICNRTDWMNRDGEPREELLNRFETFNFKKLDPKKIDLGAFDKVENIEAGLLPLWIIKNTEKEINFRSYNDIIKLKSESGKREIEKQMEVYLSKLLSK